MNDSQMLEKLAMTDAYAPHAPLPVSARTRDTALAEIERRTDMQTQKRPAPQTPLSGRRNGWLVAAGAAIAVFVLIGGFVWLVSGTGTDVVEEPMVTTTSPVPTTVTSVPVPTTVAPVPVLPVPSMVDAWQRVGGTLMAPVVGTFDMTVVGSRLFVVGFDPGEDNFRQNGVIFASDDGVNWVRLAEGDPALNLGAVLMYAVTDGGPGLVAVGMGCEDEEQGCAPYATVWTSVDGTVWTRSPYDAAIFGDTSMQTSAMVGVADTSHGLIAVGSMEYWTVDDDGVEELVTIHPVAWTSVDGITWERSWEGVGSAVLPDDYADVYVNMDSVVEGPDGRLVAVGATLNENGESIATVWTSVDGRQWERIEPDNTMFTPGTVMLDVALGEHGYVAVGTDSGTDAAIWQSPDGATWTRIETASQSFDGIGSLDSVAALDSGYVTVGPQGFIDATSGWVTMWTSPDGVTWDRVHSIAEGYASGVVVVDGGIAVSGGMSYDNDFHAAVWVGPSFDPEAPAPEPGPPPEPDPISEEFATGIGGLAEGVSCEEIATEGFTYAEALSYWIRYELTEDFDLDADGTPCADAYTDAEIAGVFGEREAMPVHIVSALPEDPEGKIFVNTGPAVDSGLICSTGTTAFVSSYDGERDGALFRWEDRFTCADGSGTFILGTDVFAEIDGTEYGIWNIVSGTGAYESLAGGGGGLTGPGDTVAWADDLVGRLASGTNEN